MTIEPNHACDRCGETFALSAPQSGPYIEVEHFLETGCRGGVLQTGPTPLDDLERQMEEFAKRMGSAGVTLGPVPAAVARVARDGALAPARSVRPLWVTTAVNVAVVPVAWYLGTVAVDLVIRVLRLLGVW